MNSILVTRFIQLITILLGVFWATAALYKAADLLGLGPITTPTTAPEYPAAVLWSVCFFEVVTAMALFSGRLTFGLGLGALMLVLFSVVLVIHPPAKGGCGCFGAHAGDLFAVDPIARNISLLGLHVLLFVATWQRKTPSPSGVPVVA